ncbi:predicted protein [Naegleria gruberi]|uniref:Predicted protein n=1 Tax=Naegleria gruberi TaxID=5762 RepID=D2VTC5_NAEGR|nr:uncharacterized protein NAEGRDRAFT_72251 [Naegleria gruberi]EFC39838.1 predicted protein [Naegleria gruberi]|eukprot:XP_002672582.1 predicted protein [Naegleria gruberi strain NEG-M]
MCEYSDDRLVDIINLEIKLQKEWYSDTIEGDIRLEIKENCNQVIRIKDITLFLQGLEKLEYQVEGPNRSLAWKSDEKKVLQSEVPIAGDGKLTKGPHVYSFSERLPTDIPGSFFEETTYLGKQIKAQISYFASCVVELRVGNEKESQHVTIHKQFEIFEKLGDRMANNLFASRNNQSCGLLWKISSRRNIYCRRDKCQFYSEVLNEGISSVSFITVRLLQILKLNMEKQNTSENIMLEVYKKTFNGILPKCKDLRNITFDLHPDLVDYFLYPQTTYGSLIRVEYMLQFSLDNLIEINIPIEVLFKQDIPVRPLSRNTISLTDHEKSNRRKSKSYYGELEDYEESVVLNDPKDQDNYHEVISLEKNTGCCTIQ